MRVSHTLVDLLVLENKGVLVSMVVEETAGGKVRVLDAVGFPEDVTNFYIFTWFCIIKE